MRSIPAWAGETRTYTGAIVLSVVYPRVGGGNAAALILPFYIAGLSPRGRGKPAVPFGPGILVRSIPAWAGETPGGKSPPQRTQVYPRVGGGNSVRRSPTTTARGLSPRGRGKRSISRSPPVVRRSIPAWAGETPAIIANSLMGRVYPRVGGGNEAGHQVFHPGGGLSPRGRGKPRSPARMSLRLRSIPAWAGETADGHTRTGTVTVYPRVGGGNATAFPTIIP